MGNCCSNFDPVSEDALAFTNDENASNQKKSLINRDNFNTKLQDGAPLLNTLDMKIVTISDSSDGSFDEATIDKMIAEAEESSNE